MINHAYIHIPFCIRKCHYCSFVSGLSLNNKAKYISALIKEINKRYKNEKLSTIYFGGGTPSLLEAEDLQQILYCFNFDNSCEITLEVNPETVTKEKFIKIKEAGFNRISLGVQTFDDNILNSIGRKHNTKIVYQAIKTIKECGFNNISIDLIYGLPNQKLEGFIKDIKKAINLNIQHISSYGLKIEEESFFGKNTPENLPDDEMQAQMFMELCKILKENNFEHYEISNFAKKGFQSNHNCAYWKNKNYYGFGLNASGYENNIRYKNTENFEEYINNPFLREEENLSIQETMENEIFLALRLKDGINISEINQKYQINFEKNYEKIITKYTSLKLLKIENNFCTLTEKGILLSNEIMSEFLD